MELILIRSARTAVAAVTWLAALGCLVPPAMADTPIQLRNITGNWKGTLSSTAWQTAADIQLVLYQSDQELRGRLYCEGGTKACHSPGASFKGSMDGRRITARVSYPDGHLCGLTGTLDGTTMRGEYSCNDEQGTDRGSWEMTLDTAGPDPESPRQVF